MESDAFSEQRIDLLSIVNSRDSYPVKPIAEIQGKPRLIAPLFKWSRETVTSTEKLDKQLHEYGIKNPDLNLEVEDVSYILESLKSVNESTKADYELLYSNQKDKPNYHDWEHAETTAAQGLKIFLGGLAELHKNPKFKEFIDANPGKLRQLIDVAIFTMSRHEQDDWWSRRSVESAALNPVDPEWENNQAQVQVNIAKKCNMLGISKEDFNRLLVLDTFWEPMSDSLAKATGENPLKEPYFKDTNGKADFSWLSADKEVQAMFLTLLGESTRSADLMQMFNPNYYRYAVLKGEGFPPEGLVTNVGSVSLAVEYEKFRPNAAKKLGWINADDTYNWNIIGVGKDFIKNFALKNIKLGVDYLKAFDKHEGHNVAEIVIALEDAVA